MTVDLWDVGQGNASVLSVSDGSLIIIDVGPRTGSLPDWLLRKPHRIRVIAITHNDSDHIGALTGIVSDPQQQIETVYLLRDPKSDRDPRKFILLYRELMERKRRGATQVLTLCQGQTLWHQQFSFWRRRGRGAGELRAGRRLPASGAIKSLKNFLDSFSPFCYTVFSWRPIRSSKVGG